MTSATFVLLSGALSFGAPMAFAIYEILSLRRGPRGGDDRDPPATAQPRPLPDCLQPHNLLRPQRIRELQDA